MSGALTFVVVTTSEDWDVYHRIRREELFATIGHNLDYDPNHPDEYRLLHFPLLLKLDGVGIGTTRLDVREGGVAIVRLVAVALMHQGCGYGRMLAERVETFARAKGVTKLQLNARPTAVGFYQRMGYAQDDWDPSEVAIPPDHVQMSKNL